MDKFVIRKSGSQKGKGVNVDNHDLSKSETDLQPPKKFRLGFQQHPVLQAAKCGHISQTYCMIPVGKRNILG